MIRGHSQGNVKSSMHLSCSDKESHLATGVGIEELHQASATVCASLAAVIDQAHCSLLRP